MSNLLKIKKKKKIVTGLEETKQRVAWIFESDEWVIHRRAHTHITRIQYIIHQQRVSLYHVICHLVFASIHLDGSFHFPRESQKEERKKKKYRNKPLLTFMRTHVNFGKNHWRFLSRTIMQMTFYTCLGIPMTYIGCFGWRSRGYKLSYSFFFSLFLPGIYFRWVILVDKRSVYNDELNESCFCESKASFMGSPVIIFQFIEFFRYTMTFVDRCV